MIALLSAVAAALALVYVKLVSGHMHNSVIGFYYFIGNVIFCPFWSFFDQRNFFPEYNWQMLVIVVAIGLLYFIM